MKLLSKNQSGFSPIIIVIGIVIIGVVGFAIYTVSQNNTDKKTTTFAGSDSMDTQKSNSSQSGQDEAPLLYNLGLKSLDGVDISTQALRDYDSRGLKGFYLFGDKLGGKEDVRINPNFEFSSVKEGTPVVSASDGIVIDVKSQGADDSEVFILPKENSQWVIGYDHIAQVSVKKGDKVKVGQSIGNPARQNNGLLRFELQVNHEAPGKSVHVCPSTLLHASVKDSVLTELKTMQEKWNTISGKQLYDISSQNPMGCYKTELTPQQAEGKAS